MEEIQEDFVEIKINKNMGVDHLPNVYSDTIKTMHQNFLSLNGNENFNNNDDDDACFERFYFYFCF
jgi:hypothetical protein